MGEYTDNNYFYLPTYKAKGLSEKEKFDDALKATDSQIATNKSDISTIKKEIFSNSYTFADRLSEIGSTDTELIINSEIAINSNTTVPANVTLNIRKGGKFTVASGVTLTINGAIKAGLYQIFDGDGTVSGSPKIEAVYPEWFGAVGDGTTDDTEAIQAAVDLAKTQKRKVFISVGVYKITNTIEITDGEFYGCFLEGENLEGVIFKSFLTGTDAVFSFRGGSGAFSNVGLKNIKIETDSTTLNQGTAILIDGQDFAYFENIKIYKLNYGIWLYNNSSGVFSESNHFVHFNIDYCNNAIRLEQGSGSNSFNGNIFENIFINIDASQIGFNHVSGYYYNGRFDLSMWSHDTTAIYINADGNCEHCIGKITYESFSKGQITGSGRFWFNGFLRGIGGITDSTSTKANNERVFSCDNYIKPVIHSTLGYMIHKQLQEGQEYDGTIWGHFYLEGNNVKSHLFSGYQYSNNAKIYLQEVPNNGDISGGIIGMHITLNGSEIKSYNSSGLSIKTHDDKTALILKAGNVGIGTISPTQKLDINSDVLRLRTAKTPSSASDTGNAGDICWDSNYIYVCVATDTWKRASLNSW